MFKKYGVYAFFSVAICIIQAGDTDFLIRRLLKNDGSEIFVFQEIINKRVHNLKLQLHFNDPNKNSLDNSKSIIYQITGIETEDTKKISVDTLSQLWPATYDKLAALVKDSLLNINPGIIETKKKQENTFIIEKGQQINLDAVSTMYEIFSNIYWLPFTFTWEVQLKGNTVPNNSFLKLPSFPAGTTVRDLKSIVRNAITENKLTNDIHYAVIITKNEIGVNDRDIIENKPFTYNIALQKTALSFKRDMMSKEILLNGINLPDFVIGNVSFNSINLTLKNINNSLKISLETSPKILGKAVTVANQNPVFQEFNHFFANDSYWQSDDFTNYKTNRLYQWYKQTIALWCQKNNVTFTENGNTVQLLSEKSRLQRMFSSELWSYWFKDKVAWLKNNTKKALLWGGSAATIGGLWYAYKNKPALNLRLPAMHKN